MSDIRHLENRQIASGHISTKSHLILMKFGATAHLVGLLDDSHAIKFEHF